jgi:hypothetical protein
VTYGTGNVQGLIAKDTISMANLTLNEHVFGVTTVESVDFSDPSVPFVFLPLPPLLSRAGIDG